MSDMIIQFIPITVLGLLWAWPVSLIARKQGRNPWLWAILVVVPVVNLISLAVFWCLTIMTILDRLNAVQGAASPTKLAS